MKERVGLSQAHVPLGPYLLYPTVPA